MTHIARKVAFTLHKTPKRLLAGGNGAGQHAYLVIHVCHGDVGGRGKQGHGPVGRQIGPHPGVRVARGIRACGHAVCSRSGTPLHRQGEPPQRIRKTAAQNHGQKHRHGQPRQGAEQQDAVEAILQCLKAASAAPEHILHTVAALYENKLGIVFHKVQAVGQVAPLRRDLLAHQKRPVHGRRQIFSIIQLVAPAIFCLPGALFGLDEGFHHRTCMPAHQIGAQIIKGKMPHNTQGRPHAQGQKNKSHQDTARKNGAAPGWRPDA